ncbi:MAG: enoyl-CoA hydratase family protein [Phycisphaerae bacterium]|nr:enoyl-CoA hydratase family protein [Phycisphaerae bacterium]NUQ44889.1 enoyl-CoA hydratase family protein [Phycisphaerae bacterium]
MNCRTFRSEQDGSILTLTLDRPDRLNALTFDVYAELRDTFRALELDETVRVVILTGAGRGFCSGGDREDIIAELFRRDAAGLRRFTKMTCDCVAAMRGCPQPIIAAINGTCVGAGAMLALAADFRYAVPSAKIGFIFTRVGLAGADMGATYLLPRVVGMTKATELLMTGDIISSDEAMTIGLLNGVVPADKLMPTAVETASRLAAGPRFGLAMTKALLNQNMGAALAQGLHAETDAQALAMCHPDFKESYEAAMQKRPPRYQ